VTNELPEDFKLEDEDSSTEIVTDEKMQSISFLDRSAAKLCPIVAALLRVLVTSDETHSSGEDIGRETDMQQVLGFLNQNEWVYNLNIGNVMQVSPVKLNDLL